MMNIFTAFNEGFVLPTRVMLKSLIENQSGALTIYVFYSSLSQESIDTIRQLEEPGRASFVFTKVDDSFLGDFSIPERFSKETYYRLFAHRIFPENVEKALWLDGDVIVNGSLSDFYYQDFQGKLFIAVEDFQTTEAEIQKIAVRKTLLKMPLDSKYVNSGVLLFNLKAMRETLNDQEIIHYLTENQEILLFADQDVFNGLLHEHFLVVDPDRWYNYFHWKITEANQVEVYSNTRVFHYCGGQKPWKENYCFLPYDLWWKYALKTGPEYLQLFFDTHCYRGEVKKAQNEIEKRSFELNTLRRELDSTKKEADALRRELDSTKKEADALRRELESAKTVADALQSELDGVHDSVSFRVGRGITYLPRMLRNLSDDYGKADSDK